MKLVLIQKPTRPHEPQPIDLRTPSGKTLKN